MSESPITFLGAPCTAGVLGCSLVSLVLNPALFLSCDNAQYCCHNSVSAFVFEARSPAMEKRCYIVKWSRVRETRKLPRTLDQAGCRYSAVSVLWDTACLMSYCESCVSVLVLKISHLAGVEFWSVVGHFYVGELNRTKYKMLYLKCTIR